MFIDRFIFLLLLRLHLVFRIIHTRLITCAKLHNTFFVFIFPSIIIYLAILAINPTNRKNIGINKRVRKQILRALIYCEIAIFHSGLNCIFLQIHFNLRCRLFTRVNARPNLRKTST